MITLVIIWLSVLTITLVVAFAWIVWVLKELTYEAKRCNVDRYVRKEMPIYYDWHEREYGCRVSQSEDPQSAMARYLNYLSFMVRP